MDGIKLVDETETAKTDKVEKNESLSDNSNETIIQAESVQIIATAENDNNNNNINNLNVEIEVSEF